MLRYSSASRTLARPGPRRGGATTSTVSFPVVAFILGSSLVVGRPLGYETHIRLFYHNIGNLTSQGAKAVERRSDPRTRRTPRRGNGATTLFLSVFRWPVHGEGYEWVTGTIE